MRPTPHSAFRTPHFLSVLLVLVLALLFTLARAIQTPEVEIGNAGAYDGAVKIRRDAAGRMIFSDSQVTSAVALNDLRYAGRDHGLLLGLLGDDHPQYQNGARHTAAHNADGNASLPVPPDVHANTTLGAHLADSAIHLNRAAAETVPGAWQFSGLPDFLSGLNLAGGGLLVGGATVIGADRSWSGATIPLARGGTGNDAFTAGKFLVCDGVKFSSAASGPADFASASHNHSGVYEPALPAGSAAQFLRGDRTWQTLNQAAVSGLTAADSPAFAALAPGNLALSGNTLSSTNANGNILIAPNGSGKIGLGGVTTPHDLLSLTGGRMRFSSSNSAENSYYGGVWYDDSSFTQLVLWNSYGNNSRIDFRIGGDSSEAYTKMRLTANGSSSGKLGVNTLTPQAELHVDGSLSITGTVRTGGSAATAGVTRLDANGAATLTQADVDNLRLDGNTLSTTNLNGDLGLAPNGSGKVTVTGELSVNAAGGKITLNGQRFLNEVNLLDNPDFTLWQRGTSRNCAAGGNAAGTLTWPVPGTLTTCADRWQVSRAKTDTTTTISRATPPASLPTALYCLKNEVVAGATARQYIHQTLSRELTAGLRGKWVTFAVSHYISGAAGGTLGIYTTNGGAPTSLAQYAFTSPANTWERVALAAQVPANAEVLLVSIVSNLSASGPTTAYLANAVLVEGKYVTTTEKVGDPALSSIPPLPRRAADDLAACQRYFERGSLAFTVFAPDSSVYDYLNTVHFNAPKASNPTIDLTSLFIGPLYEPTVSTIPCPAFSPGIAYPQGFRLSISATSTASTTFPISADWTATCPEPI